MKTEKYEKKCFLLSSIKQQNLEWQVTKKGSGGKTNLDSVVDWIRLVGHKSRMMDMDGGEGDRSAVQPRIVVVGTHKDKLHKVEVMQLSMANFKFERLMEDVRKSGLEHLVSFPFFAVDATRPCRTGNGSRNSKGDGEDDQVDFFQLSMQSAIFAARPARSRKNYSTCLLAIGF